MMKTVFQNGLDVLREYESTPRLTSGNVDLDSLLAGGVELGSFMLIYGANSSLVDKMLYRFICSSILPVETNGFGNKAVLLSCGDYHQEQALVDMKLASGILRANGIDPAKGLDDIIAVSAFNPDQAEKSVEDIVNIVKYHDQVKLIVVKNLAKLFIDEARDKTALEKIQQFQHLIAKLWQACAQRGVTLIVSCRPRRSDSPRPSQPEGGIFLRHLAQVILCIKRREETGQWTAHLLKHPKRQPRTAEFMFDQGDSIMGRLTIPFRRQLQLEIENLTRTLKEALTEPARRDVFNSLARAWTLEQGARSYAKVPSVLEIMLLTAAVDNRKTIEDLYDQLVMLRSQLEKVKSEMAETKITLKTIPDAIE